MTYRYSFNVPLGTCTVQAKFGQLEELYFDYGRYLPEDGPDIKAENEKPTNLVNIFQETQTQLLQYFSGQRTHFHLPLKMRGTGFQQKVWKVISQIPFGTTITYLQETQKVGGENYKAYRAVGSANGCNPFPVIIPCHRVVSSNQAWGGFSNDLAMKKELILFELLVLESAK